MTLLAHLTSLKSKHGRTSITQAWSKGQLKRVLQQHHACLFLLKSCADIVSCICMTFAGFAAEQEVQEERSPAVRVGRGRGGRGGRGGRRGRGATSVSAGSEGQGALAGPALPARGAQQGKRKADQMEGSTAQQAKHAKHVLKRVEKGKTLCCPLCHSDTIFACDKLGGVSYAELKLIMGYV